MIFAIFKGTKIKAYKGGKGICPCCSSDLITKCDDVKINHWHIKEIGIVTNGGRTKRNVIKCHK